MAFSTGSHGCTGAEINVTPLIDVLLVLLIIFMVLVPTAPRGLPASPVGPGAPAVTPSAAEQPILLEAALARPATAGEDEAVLYCVNGTLVRGEDRGQLLRTLLQARSERQVLIQADAAFQFGSVARLVEEAQSAGADTVGLIGSSRKSNCIH